MKPWTGRLPDTAVRAVIGGGRMALKGLSRLLSWIASLLWRTNARMPDMPEGGKSLRFRLCVFFSLFLVAAWLLAAFFAWKECREYIDEFFDSQQMLFAKRLATSDFTNSIGKLPETKKLLLGAHKGSFGKLEDEAIGFAVFTIQGKKILTDGEKGRRFPFEPDRIGFSDERLTGKKDVWRIVRLASTDGRHMVAVGQEIDYRRDMAFSMLEKQIVPWLFLLPVLLLGLFALLSRELTPLNAIASELRTRDPENTSPLDVRRIPSEVLPMAESLNTFFARTSAMLTRERSFISDAAHELRTPLAGLGVQAQVAARQGVDSQTRKEALALLRQGIDRCARLVDQLLALSRLEALHGTGATPEGKAPERPSDSMAWASILENLAGEYRVKAENRDVRFESQVESLSAAVKGYPDLASMMLRNLLENAVSYTPAGGHIRMTLEGNRLIVNNTCTHLPEAYVSRLGERFFRPPGQEAPGSGLGLSIVKRVADIHGFTVDIRTGQDALGTSYFFHVIVSWGDRSRR